MSFDKASLQTLQRSTGSSRHVIKWDKLTENDILQYRTRTEEELSKVQLNHSLILCGDPNCSDLSHHKAIDLMYDSTISALKDAGIPLSKSQNLDIGR